ncbi:MAG: hypothetical protein KKE50_07425, partial [Nanoarchaeota archaeon]|nr:hypothetical protein [Nanoarchaeota archaeon]
DNPAEGKYSLRLNGVVEFLDRWPRDIPDDKRKMKPYFFNTAQTLILKPATRFKVSFQGRMAGADGLIEVRSVPVGDCYGEMEYVFAPQKMKTKGGDRGWQKYSFEFDMPAGKSTFSLVFANRSKLPAWIDDVKIFEVGPAKVKIPVEAKLILSGFSLAERLASGELQGVWGIYGKEPREKELQLVRSTGGEGAVEFKEIGGRGAAVIRSGSAGYGPIVYVQLPQWLENHAEVDLFIEYLDAGSGQITLNYSANDGGYISPYDGSVRITGSGKWKTVRWRLTDANFKAGPGGGFRVWVPNGGALGALAVLLPDQVATKGFEEKAAEKAAVTASASADQKGTTELSRRLLSRKLVGAWGYYGDKLIETGLIMLPGSKTGEGLVEMVNAGGRRAAGIRPGGADYGRYYYFKLPDWIKEGSEYDIAVEYFDGGKGKIICSYDAKEYSCKGCDQPIELTGSGEWKVVSWHVNDALFNGRGNGGSDFRLGSAPDGFALGAVAVLAPGQLGGKLLKKPEAGKTTEKAETVPAGASEQVPPGNWSPSGSFDGSK